MMVGVDRHNLASVLAGFVIGVTGLGAGSLAAVGQPDDDALSEARACGRIVDDAERLACLDAVLATDTGMDAVAEIDDGSISEAGKIEIQTRPEVVDAVVESDAEIASTDSVSEIADQTAAGSTETSSVERTIRVVEIRRTPLGVTTFHTENGEVWVQRSGTLGRYPAGPFEARLLPAMRGTFFLVSPLGGPRARVLRAQ